MTEEQKMRLELLELKMEMLMWVQTDAQLYGYIDKDKKKRDERIKYLEEMIKILNGRVRDDD